MPNPKPPYPAEFRAEAVRLARAPGQTIRFVAMDLEISNESLRRWVIQAEIDRGDSPGLTSDERAELTRLRRENRTLRIEREILKKAAVSSTSLSFLIGREPRSTVLRLCQRETACS